MPSACSAVAGRLDHEGWFAKAAGQPHAHSRQTRRTATDRCVQTKSLVDSRGSMIDCAGVLLVSGRHRPERRVACRPVLVLGDVLPGHALAVSGFPFYAQCALCMGEPEYEHVVGRFIGELCADVGLDGEVGKGLAL